MKVIRNKTRRPIRVHLAGGGTLHLGPGKTGQVSGLTAEKPAFRKLVEQDQIELLDEGEGATTAEANAPANESTHKHGHPPTKVVLPKGNR